MNFDKVRDIEPAQRAVCPVTGLPIFSKPEWTDVSFGKDYKATISIVGDSILRVQPSGYVTLSAQKNVLRLTGQVPDEAISGGQPYVQIEDWSNFRGASLAARRYFINAMPKRDRISSLIFCHVSVMFKMSIKLGKRLSMVKLPVHIVDDYSEAVRLALEIQSKEKGFEDKPVVAPSYDKYLSKDTFPADEESICPVTSLPITTKPEWTDIPIDDNYSVSFRLIGKGILCMALNGILSKAGTQKLLVEREKVLIEAGLLDKKYAEIVDYSMYAGYPSKEIRMMLANCLLKEIDAGNLLGISVFNPPLFVKWMFNVSAKIYKKPTAVSIAGDYKEAIENAVNMLEKSGVDVGVRQYTKFTKDEWGLELENYGIRFELIGDDLIYSVAHGSMKEAYIAKFFDLHEKVLEEAGLTAKGYYYRIVNWENLEKTTWKARKMYLDGIRDLNRKIPCKFSVLFGLNKFMRAIIGFSKQFVPIPITTTRNFEEAMAIIKREKKRGPGTEVVKNKRKPEEASTYREINKYSDELLQFMGAINWDQEGTAWEDISDSHPFKAVFDAMAIIKEDVDDLFRERKQAEKEIRQYSERLEEMVEERTKDLKKSEEKYRTILENIEDGYYEVDLDGNLAFFNDATCKIAGYSEDELMGMNNREYTDGKNAGKLYREYNKIYETGIPTKRLDWEMVKKDGTTGFLETSISLITGSDGQPVGFRGIIRDVTERKELEHEIMEKSRLAEEASKAKSEFLANMSHEIRTPLNGIIGMVELALDTKLDDNQKNIFHTINTEADSLQDVINEILDFSKIEAGKLDLEEIPFDLRMVIENVAGSFSYRAEQKGLEIFSFLSPDVPSLLIGDPGRLRQILVNLAGNALKFTNEGEIYIKGEVDEDYGDRVKVRFSIKDTGIGIPKDKQSSIFEGFTQADGSTTRKYGGTGLGTTISKQLAELMGGEIGVESPSECGLEESKTPARHRERSGEAGGQNPNNLQSSIFNSQSKGGPGSNFWFTAVFDKQKGHGAVLAAEKVDLNDLRVLVVDDNQTNRFILTEHLRSWGCLTVEASNGKDALIILSQSVLSEEPFNLILTDFQMPGMSGFDLAREIRSMETLKAVPIIVLTSAGMKGDGESCREIRINGYLTKPIRRDDLRRVIEDVLGHSVREEDQTGPRLVTRHTIAEDDRKGARILLVEDYPTNQVVAMRHLHSAGHQVDLAENGQQAVEAFKRKQYDLILMDIQMPVMDGYGATKAIRILECGMRSADCKEMADSDSNSAIRNPKSAIKRVPIIAMTAHAIKGYRERCLEAGMDDYIAKPLRRKGFLNIIDKWSKGIDDSAVVAKATMAKSACRLNIEDLKNENGDPEQPSTVNPPEGRRTSHQSSIDNHQSSIINRQSTIINHQSKNVPMNFEKVLDDFEGDKELLVEAMGLFLESVRNQIGALRQAISDNDADLVRREAHSIKGGAANLTADELSRAAFELETIGKSGTLGTSTVILERLEKEFYRLDAFAKDR